MTKYSYDNKKFTIENFCGEYEFFNLAGNYVIEKFVNEKKNGIDMDLERAFQNKSVFSAGNVLYNVDEPMVKQYINEVIKATYTPSMFVSVGKVQYPSGTVIPSKEMFSIRQTIGGTIYGRYIHAYDTPGVVFIREDVLKLYTKKVDNSYDFEEQIWQPVLSEDKIILPSLPYTDPDVEDEYNYSFSIVDNTNNVLLAFAVYR